MRAGATLHLEIVRSVLDRNRWSGSVLVCCTPDWNSAVCAITRFEQKIFSVGVQKLARNWQVFDYNFVSTYFSPIEVVGYLKGAKASDRPLLLETLT